MLLAGSKQFLVHVRHQANVHVLRDCLRFVVPTVCVCGLEGVHCTIILQFGTIFSSLTKIMVFQGTHTNY